MEATQNGAAEEKHEHYHSRFPWTPGVTLEQVEKETILAAFQFYRHNKTATAQALGISVKTLSTKLISYQVLDKERKVHTDEQRIESDYWLKRSRGIQCDPPPSVVAKQQLTEKIRASTQGGNGVEPASDAGQESEVPVSEREKIQKLLPNESPARRHQSGRR